MTSKAIKGRRGLIVDFDWGTRLWSATHEVFLQPLVRAFERVQHARAARLAFPNATGNYEGKRTPVVPAPPLEPRERFNRLAADYQAHAMTYRNPPRFTPAMRRFFAAWRNSLLALPADEALKLI